MVGFAAYLDPRPRSNESALLVGDITASLGVRRKSGRGVSDWDGCLESSRFASTLSSISTDMTSLMLSMLWPDPSRRSWCGGFMVGMAIMGKEPDWA